VAVYLGWTAVVAAFLLRRVLGLRFPGGFALPAATRRTPRSLEA
jgi:hypothetical protein